MPLEQSVAEPASSEDAQADIDYARQETMQAFSAQLFPNQRGVANRRESGLSLATTAV